MDFNMIMHYINGLCALFALFGFFYFFKFHGHLFNGFPKMLRLFILFGCTPWSILLTLNCLLVSVVAIATNNSKEIVYTCLRLSILIIGQQLRFSYFGIILDRMMATIFLEKYTKFVPTLKTFFIYLLFSFIAQCPSSLPSFLSYYGVIPATVLTGGYDMIVWTSFVMHALTLIICKILYDKNRKMYRLLAYQCTLQQRHQIVENIKVLQTLWPTVFVFSVISPIGPAATLAYSLITKAVGPIGLFHTTYNLVTIILALYYFFDNHKKHIFFNENKTLGNLVISPLGTVLPTHITQDNYFNGLQNQWN